MPQINLIPEVLYEPDSPYHYHYDNIPLRNILARISLVNIQTDQNAEAIRGTSGTTGSLKNRLDFSLEDDGSLKKSSVDASMHSIANHEDGLGSDGIEYVRMTLNERASLLSLVESGPRLTIQVDDEPTLSSGNVEFRSSSTIAFSLEAPNVVRAHNNLPPDVAHRHSYGLTPAHQSPGSEDWQNFLTTSLSTPYIEGSLRVYINGVRLNSENYVPIFDGSSTPSSWMLFSVSDEDPENGSFQLNAPMPYPHNNIRIDFDTSVPF